MAKGKRKCIGYGEFEGKCDNDAGSTHSEYWCQRCDDIRLATIDASLEGMIERLGQRTIRFTTLSERLEYKASLDYGEGYVDNEDVADALALETALADEKAGRKLLADTTDKLRECEAKLAEAVNVSEALARELGYTDTCSPDCKERACPDPSKWADHCWECWLNWAKDKATTGGGE
jgi:hypothetical protein